MTDPAIHTQGLTKVYTVSEREADMRAAVQSLVHRRTEEVRAVDWISFELAPAEVVGVPGPNLGNRERIFRRRLALAVGQHNQRVWDIPAADSFELNRAIYRLPAGDFKRTVDELTELLDLGPLLQKPVRNLSLGERKKREN